MDMSIKYFYMDDSADLGAAPVNRLTVPEAEPLTVGNETVSEPITTPPEPTLIGVPLIIVLGPPLPKVTPSTAINPSGPIAST